MSYTICLWKITNWEQKGNFKEIVDMWWFFTSDIYII